MVDMKPTPLRLSPLRNMSSVKEYYRKLKSISTEKLLHFTRYIRSLANKLSAKTTSLIKYLLNSTKSNTISMTVEPKNKFASIECRKYMGTSLEYNIINTNSSGDYKRDIEQICNNEQFQNLFETYFNNNGPFSSHIEFCIIFNKITSTTGEEVKHWAHSKNDKPITHISHLKDYLYDLTDYFISYISEYEGRGSDLQYKELPRLTTRLKKFNPSTGSSYIRLPAQVLNTRAYVNVKNTNNECFKYAIVSALHLPNNHIERPNQYEKYFNEINFDGLTFPVQLSKKTFRNFEENNTSLPPLNIHCLNNYNDKLPFPYYCSIKNPNATSAINLLHFQNEKKSIGHFCWMRHISRALSSLTKHDGATFICVKCYTKYTTREALIAHDARCLMGEEPQIREMPHCKKHESNKSKCSACKCTRTLQFRDFKAQQEIPVLMICDTEAITEPRNEATSTKTTILAEQHGIGYCIYFVVADYYRPYFPKYVDKVITYTGSDMARHLLKNIKYHTESISKIIQEYDMPMENITSEHLDVLKENGLILTNDMKVCHICKCNITNQNDCVADHCHFSGYFRGFAHKTCNFEYTIKNKMVSIIFHNFRGYDCKMIIEAVRDFPSIKFKPIMENSEKIKCMSMIWGDKFQYKCKFIDSYMHMNTSLDELVQDLADYKHDKISFTEHISNTDITKLRTSFPAVSAHLKNDVQFKLILRKGVFPYEWFSSSDKLKHTELLDQNDFYSSLRQASISLDDYNFYLQVWQTFNMKTFKDYYDLYLLLDVLLLADVCRAHRELCMAEYGLDPFWFVSAPSLAWQAALKTTNVKLELLTNIDMYNFIQHGIRGGVSCVVNKYAEANNYYMQSLYDKDKNSTFIDYIDMNNLYGYAMMQPLPIGGFKWVENIIHKITSKFGYMYEVDLLYPEELHSSHSDFPLAPESWIPPGSKQEKLIPHFLPRKNYVVDGQTLDYYLKKGLIIEKIHKCLQYRQSPWLKSYIELNSNLRASSTTEFAKNFFKLMNNSVYGQTLMDVTKFLDFEFVNTQKRYKALHRKPHLIKNEPFVFPCSNCDDNNPEADCSKDQNCFVAVEKLKTKILLNRPIYTGFKILELSKLHMYKFWYDILKANYDNKLQLLMTDTDSFIFKIECDDIFEELAKYKHMFDFSNYDKTHKHFSTQNKKVPGKMKREYPGDIIIQFVGLRSKCYSFKFLFDQLEKKVAKGVTRVNKEKHITFDDYVKVLTSQNPKTVTETKLQSNKMRMHLIEQEKVALDSDDDKRIWLGHDKKPLTEEWGRTVPHGHYQLINSDNKNEC
jgi:hypothetical protein